MKIGQQLQERSNVDLTPKYIVNPDLSPAKRAPRPSKLDAHRDLIKEFVEADPQVKAPVVLQRLQDNGFDGKITIVRDYLLKLRGRKSSRRAFIRFESPPGRQMQIDWGHFGSLRYGDTMRKLYALAAIECYTLKHLDGKLLSRWVGKFYKRRF